MGAGAEQLRIPALQRVHISEIVPNQPTAATEVVLDRQTMLSPTSVYMNSGILGFHLPLKKNTSPLMLATAS